MKWLFPFILVTLVIILGWRGLKMRFDHSLSASKALSASRQAVVDVDRKNPLDKRLYRTFALENKLEVFLISDPELNKSAAAMDVGIGSLQDPQEHLGLAHFLEHMLFLGTEKYPDVEEYNRYLHSFQGSSNAYTAAENTNYHFEVNHAGFEGSLDRFAQFFIAPLFNSEYVARERNAVHSEHQKNLQDDYWRARMVQRLLHKQGHPRQKFSTGDKNTLASTTREILRDFYEKNYSANLMKLVLLSNYPLDTMEAWARKYFHAIANRDLKRPVYDLEQFAAADLPRLVKIKPIKDVKRLTLQFALPSKEGYWQTKPGSVLSHLIGHEGQGSLLSLLKHEDLVTSLSAGLESATYGGLLQVELTLTEQGVAEKEKIMAYFFAYIKLLKQQGLERYIFDELKTMGDINFVYRDLIEGSGLVASYASLMHLYPALEIDKRELLMREYSPKDFAYFLSFIRPETVTAFLSHPGVSTDQVEVFYNTHYKVTQIAEPLVQQWRDVAIPASLTLPAPNPFIPQKLEVVEFAKHSKPYKLIDNEWGVFWFQGDDTFKLPKANVQLLLLQKDINATPEQKVLSLLYNLAIREELNEWNYDISLAGLTYMLTRVDRGIQFDFFGYAENIPFLMRSVAEKMRTISIDAKRFAALKDDLLRNVANARLDVAYQQLMYEMKFLSTKGVIHRDDIYNPAKGIDLISPITLEQVQAYAKTVYNEFAIEGVAYGSIAAGELESAVKDFYTAFHAKILPESLRPENAVLVYEVGKPRARVLNVNNPNHCWGESLQFGARDPLLNAAIRVGHAHLQTSFFTELRTKQQLGYVVYSGLSHQEKVLGLLFLVQSSEYDPLEIAERVRTWKKQALTELEALTPEQLEAYKAAVASELRERDKTMADKHQSLIFEALVMKGEFGYKERIAQAVEKLNKADVITAFKRAFAASSEAALAVYLVSDSQKVDKTPREAVIEDVRKFKAAASYF